MKKLLYLMIVLTIISCDSTSERSTYENNSEYEEEWGNDYEENEEEEFQDNTYGFEDGSYSATVDYYNPSTGYSATYSLTVEVYNNQVTTIYFPNDGYLDEDHIWPDELDENGFVSIEGEDGKTYNIQIDY
jgi:hypothetical protein